ncbi:hypothetical protein GCM10022215_31940 [Nocardioides fonticola]|uniref:Uncharacterized protein n=1 Tax=Nocardioides fonticola TaxID=450363 RepID=A0ABP7XRE4_9ACTN
MPRLVRSIAVGLVTALVPMVPLVSVASAGADPAWLDAGPTSPSRAAVPPLHPCIDPDHGDPAITRVSFRPTSIDIRRRPATVHVRVKVADTGGPGRASGPARGEVSFTRGVAARLHVVDRSTMAGTVTIGRNEFPGRTDVTRLLLDEVTVVDQAGNTTDLVDDDLAAVAASTGIDVVGVPDREPPVISRLRATRTRLDARRGDRRIVLTARIHDAVGDVVRPQVSIYSLGRRGSYNAQIELRSLGGDRFRGVWRVPRWAPHALQRYRIDSISVSDSTAGTRFRVRRAPFIQRQLGTDIVRVRSRVDTTPPRVRDVRLSPSAIDLTDGPRTVVARIRVIDRQSPVRAVSFDKYAFWAASPLPQRSRLVSGDRHDGVWEVRVPTRCSINRTPYAAEPGVWFVADGASLHRTYRLRNHDVSVVLSGESAVQPRYRASAVDTSSIRVRFGAAVLNLTDAAGELTRPDGTVIPGSWTACADAVGASVSCLDGPVRTAVYTADDPLASGARVSLTVNPSGVLDARTPYGMPPVDYPAVAVIP